MKLARLNDGPEIFHTIQGEGATAGYPAVFIRTSRCNLHCVWCDTDHTWNFEGTPWPHLKDGLPAYTKFNKDEATCEMSPEDAAERILAHDCPRVVLTGGEPLLQEQDLLALIAILRARRNDMVFEIETNGTRTPSAEMAKAIDQFNVSPKLANSCIKAELRLVPDALNALAALPHSWFKFVVSSPEDLSEIEELLKNHPIRSSRVILMPEGRSCEVLDERAKWLADCCRDRGFRYGERLHVRLWGDKRGV